VKKSESICPICYRITIRPDTSWRSFLFNLCYHSISHEISRVYIKMSFKSIDISPIDSTYFISNLWHIMVIKYCIVSGIRCQETLTIILKYLIWDLFNISVFELETMIHNLTPKTQIDLRIVLYNSNLFSMESCDLLPNNRYILSNWNQNLMMLCYDDLIFADACVLLPI